MKSNHTTDETLDPGRAQVRRDLYACFHRFPVTSLLHLRNNFDRLIRGAYKKDGGGCVFHLLSKVLWRRIQSRQDLIRFFAGKAADDCDDPVYRPAKHIVKIWDADLSNPDTRIRYPGVNRLEKRFLWTVLIEAIELRQATAAKAGRRTTTTRSSRRSAVLALPGL